ncbi:hypothetical protein Cni_G02519 [Canna indica]|uniref:Myb-like domain-containing protein n=1 Tax=Canna indica TaxID=4628 RepID=A0AAQ3Q098_9LILI|nr:hypothetical protein Cni_G02519 [Canna indica]
MALDISAKLLAGWPIAHSSIWTLTEVPVGWMLAVGHRKFLLFSSMDNPRKKQRRKLISNCSYSEEVSSVEWELINMTEQEEDLVYRMFRLVGDRWDLIAGRIPGRRSEDLERFWIMKHGQGFQGKSRS